MTALCVIPARGGSKRIPRKNIKPFFGIPMLQRAIQTAQDASIFDEIIVSTDCDEIAQIAQQCGAEVPFQRPASLSDDFATTIDVIVHAIEALEDKGFSFDAICCLYPCTPFTTSAMLREGFAQLKNNPAAYTFPVCAFPSAPQRALKRALDGRMSPLQPEFEMVRTQDLEPAYFDAGQFYWGRNSAWRAKHNIHSHGTSLIVDELTAIDIDTPEDWHRAERLYAAFHGKDNHP